MPVATRPEARSWARRQRNISRRVVGALARLWSGVDLSSLEDSWDSRIPAGARLLSSGQRVAATGAQDYVSLLVEGQGEEPDPVGELAPAAFSGVASDGRPLESLLANPVIATRVAQARGANDREALHSGLLSLSMLAQTQIADAGRAASSVAMAADTAVAGYERHVNLPACGRCIQLAGRLYKYNEGFLRHPRCLVAGTLVSGPSLTASTRRWYEGELVVVHTASGKQLTITGNHPVLTDRGWLPAHFIDESCYVASSTLSGGALSIATPYERQMPALVEDVWSTGRVLGITRVPTTAEDFHGDGIDGEVDVVSPDRMLRQGIESALSQHVVEHLLAIGVEPASFPLSSSPFQLSPSDAIDLCLAQSFPVAIDAFLPLSVRIGVPIGLGFGTRASLDASFVQPKSNRSRGHAVPTTEALGAFASLVSGDDVSHREVPKAPRWDAPTGPFTVENRLSYAGRGLDLLKLLANQVALDRVVELSRISWSGHVFNATSNEGWYSAGGIVVSNCDCTHVPVTEEQWRTENTDQTPDRLFESMSREEQEKAFTKAGAQAIRDGADVSQVVNARRGMSTAVIGGREVQTTIEGITRQGIAGRRLEERFGSRVVSQHFRQTRGGERLVRQRGSRAPRLMPEMIYRVTESREHAIDLLRLHGYII